MNMFMVTLFDIIWICSLCVIMCLEKKMWRCQGLVSRKTQGMLRRRCQKYKHTDMLIGSLSLSNADMRKETCLHTFQEMTHTHKKKKLLHKARLYTENMTEPLHTEALYTQTRLHTNVSTHTQGFSPTTVFKHKNSYTQLFSYQQILFYTQTLYSEVLIHRNFCT